MGTDLSKSSGCPFTAQADRNLERFFSTPTTVLASAPALSEAESAP